RMYVTGEEIARAEIQRAIRIAGIKSISPAQMDELVRREISRHHHDWFEFGTPGHFFAYWPPVPTLIMLPFVAISGTDASDILVDNLLGAITILFVYLTLRELPALGIPLTTPACAGLALFYGLGTCHLWQACIGQVWFLTQLAATLFLTIAIWCGLRAIRRPAWILPAGVALGLGFVSRNTIVLGAPFLVFALWLAVRERPDRVRTFVKWGTSLAAILLLSVVVQLALNQARFGDWRDFGQGHLADSGGNPRFAE